MGNGDCTERVSKMSGPPHLGVWVGIGAFAALAVDVALLCFLGVSQASIALAASCAARVAFVFFWLTYAGGAIPVFFGLTVGSPLTRRRREFGLAFAGALTVHLCGVAWLFLVSPRQPISNAGIVYFGIGALFTFALAISSFNRIQTLLRPWAWWLLNLIGLEYIAYLFFLDFIRGPFSRGNISTITYFPFAILILTAPMLRWAAKIWRWLRPTESAA